MITQQQCGGRVRRPGPRPEGQALPITGRPWEAAPPAASTSTYVIVLLVVAAAAVGALAYLVLR